MLLSESRQPLKGVGTEVGDNVNVSLENCNMRTDRYFETTLELREGVVFESDARGMTRAVKTPGGSRGGLTVCNGQ